MTESIWQAKAKKSHWLSYQRVWLSNLRRCVLETDELYGVPPSFAAPDEPDLLSACLSGDAKCALVVDLDETLVHAKFHQHSGWMIHQRAGAQKFLVEMAKLFEIIIFTSGIETYASPIIDRLDPQRVISHRLYRPATSMIKGLHVKNLARLARPLQRVIILDNSPESYILQPENAIPMKPYFGDESDAFLLNLIPVLENLHGLSDVRPAIMRIHKRGFPSLTRSMPAGADDQELLFPAPNPDALWQGDSSSVSPAAPPPAPRIGSFKNPSCFPSADALPDISLGQASLPKQGIHGFSIPGNSPPPARQRSMSIFSSLQEGASVRQRSLSHATGVDDHLSRDLAAALASVSDETRAVAPRPIAKTSAPRASPLEFVGSAPVSSALLRRQPIESAPRAQPAIAASNASPAPVILGSIDKSPSDSTVKRESYGSVRWSFAGMQDVLGAMSPPPAPMFMPHGASLDASSDELQSPSAAQGPHVDAATPVSARRSSASGSEAGDEDEHFQMDL